MTKDERDKFAGEKRIRREIQQNSSSIKTCNQLTFMKHIYRRN